MVKEERWFTLTVVKDYKPNKWEADWAQLKMTKMFSTIKANLHQLVSQKLQEQDGISHSTHLSI